MQVGAGKTCIARSARGGRDLMIRSDLGDVNSWRRFVIGLACRSRALSRRCATAGVGRGRPLSVGGRLDHGEELLAVASAQLATPDDDARLRRSDFAQPDVNFSR